MLPPPPTTIFIKFNRYIFREKIFKFQESVLMIYFKEENYKTIYNISCATFFLLFVNLILSDYVETGVILDMDSFIFCFGNSEKTIYPLIISFIINLLIVPIVKISITNKWGPTFYIPLFTILVCVINGIACYICINNTLALGSAMI